MKKTTFEKFDLDSKLIQAIVDCGYFSCTPIQEKTLPTLLKHEDCFIQSKTGSGKTAAFCIPLIQNLNFEDSFTSALILAPTRELALQIQHEFNRLGIYKNIHCVCCIGRQDFSKQVLQLKQKAHVVVGTPGRIMDHIINGSLDVSSISTLVIDEANEMVSLGLLDQVQKLVKKLPKHKTWLFSATLDTTLDFSFLNVRKPIVFEIDSSGEVTNQVATFSIQTDDKDTILTNILDHTTIESCCIFANTREEVERINSNLSRKGYLCTMIHGGMEQKQRIKNTESFKKGKTRILIATDIAARGLDISGISHVIHYDCPNTYDSYIHRSGRSGRKDDRGLSITLISKNDRSSIKNQLIEETTPFSISKTFVDNHFNKPIIKEDKDVEFNTKNLTIFIRAGKKDKLRNLDIVGSLCANTQIKQDNIGIIDIQQLYSTVTLLNTDDSILGELSSLKIKGKNRKIEIKKK